MHILGLSASHDAAAALVVDGAVVAHAAEERFQRIKHCDGIPFEAVRFCLQRGGVSSRDLAVIAAEYEPQIQELFHPNPAQTKVPLNLPRFPASQQTELLPVDHHLAHAASAYYTSGCHERVLVVTCDGIGGGTSASVWRGEGGTLTKLAEFDHRASLGWFYESVTEALGWWSWDGAGKTMGLAPYGDSSGIAGILDPFCPRFENGEWIGDTHRDNRRSMMIYRGTEHIHHGQSEAIAKLAEKYGRENVAAEAQRLLEEQVMQLILPWLEREDVDRLACAGGIFLNVKLNQRIWETGRVRMHHVFPDAGDAGLAIGAALYAHHQANPNAPIGGLEGIYWGPCFEDDVIGRTLEGCGLTPRRVDDPAAEAAALLAEGKIVGWFQGRMESGPRALGGRSILMSPLEAANKDILNSRVKFREGFRPFCPSIAEESLHRYIRNGRLERYMITSFDVPEEMRTRIPAVVHVDGTTRPQAVEEHVNSLYWRLVTEFGKLTGEPVVLNTSFNVKGEPIVNTPLDATRCFFGTGMDAIFIGGWRVSK